MDEELVLISEEIFRNIISQLTMHLRFMDIALDNYIFVPNSTSIECDGTFLYYHPISIITKFKNDPKKLTHGYLHIVLHSIFSHPFLTLNLKKGQWDLACDIFVENMILDMNLDCTKQENEQEMRKEIEKIRERVPAMTAQKIYHYLEDDITKDENKLLAELFTFDDHSRWYAIRDVIGSDQKLFGDEIKDDPTKSGNNQFDNASHDSDEEAKEGHDGDGKDDVLEIKKIKQAMDQWKDISEKMETDLDTFHKDFGDNVPSLTQALARLHQEKYDYTHFLRKFMTIGEKQMINDDEFDYIYYTYGLQVYKNMPLIEALEYKETRAIKDFVIAIDTSGSVSGDLVQGFLQKTYNIFKQKDNFFNHFNIHILQCDTKIQDEVKVTNLQEFERYIETMELKGFGGTDFRPVFNHCNELIQSKEFLNMGGVIYFTDGDGIFPKQKPSYQAAFIFLDQAQRENAKVPAWAMSYVLDEDEILYIEEEMN